MKSKLTLEQKLAKTYAWLLAKYGVTRYIRIDASQEGRIHIYVNSAPGNARQIASNEGADLFLGLSHSNFDKWFETNVNEFQAASWPVTREDLEKFARSANQRAETWILAWNKHHDASAAKNVLFALGRASEAFQMLSLSQAAEGPMPEDIEETFRKQDVLYEEIMQTYFKTVNQETGA